MLMSLKDQNVWSTLSTVQPGHREQFKSQVKENGETMEEEERPSPWPYTEIPHEMKTPVSSADGKMAMPSPRQPRGQDHHTESSPLLRPIPAPPRAP